LLRDQEFAMNKYRLTALGSSLLEPLTALVMWAERSQPKIQRARAQFDGATAVGR